MKIFIKKYLFSALIIVCLFTLTSCEPDEFDGLNVVDPLPEVPISFPQAIGWENRMQMSWNAFTFNESISDGEVSVQIAVPEGFQINGIQAIRGQRIRGNIGPRNEGGRIQGTSRAPSRFDRTIAPNYGENISVNPNSTVTWSMTLDELNELESGSLGEVQAGDGLRLLFTVSLSDGRELTAVELRVILVN